MPYNSADAGLVAIAAAASRGKSGWQVGPRVHHKMAERAVSMAFCQKRLRLL